MLTSLRIENFKAWKDTGAIRLAPLTVIFGANSAGKSSLGHLLLALKQTSLSTDWRRALHLGDANSLIDLGKFVDCIHGHDLSVPMSFQLAWRLPKALEVNDPLQKKARYRGDQLDLKVVLEAGKTGQPEVTELTFALGNLGNEDTTSKTLDVALDVAYVRNEQRQFTMESETYNFVRTLGKPWPLDEPEKFYRISEQTRARYQNASFLTDFALATESMLGKLHYLGPLREIPKRTYPWSGEVQDHVGFKGEYAIAAILAAQEQKRLLNRGPRCRQLPFSEFIAGWLEELGIIHSFSVQPVAAGRREYEVLVRTHAGASEVKITDVGFGVSQVLPALVEAFYCPPGSVVWMEQPEIHLHPQVQAKLADVFISAIKSRENSVDRNVQLIIESHSEHFLNRLQRRIAEGEITPQDVAIYFCKRSGKETVLDLLRVNIFGEIENWPEDFFGNEMEDLTARTVAAMKIRKEKSGR